MNQDKFKVFIKQLRLEKNWSQYNLADIIPISRQAVSKWERGKTIPDSQTLIRLSEIFDVTINELLKGERIQNNSIKELESTALSMVDQNNKKSNDIRKLLRISITSILSLLLLFFAYYFINSYNSIKVYVLSGDSENFILYDGLFIVTKQKIYLKIGNVISKNEYKINNARIFYTENNINHTIYEDEDIDKIIFYLSGYEEYFPREDFDYVIKNLYLKITYEEDKEEIIKINCKRDFVNNYVFYKDETVSKKNNTEVDDSEVENKIKEKIIKEGVYEDNTYAITWMEDKEEVKLTYHEENNQIVLMENMNIVWSVMLDNHYYSCREKLSQSMCKKKAYEDIQKYKLLSDGTQ